MPVEALPVATPSKVLVQSSRALNSQEHRYCQNNCSTSLILFKWRPLQPCRLIAPITVTNRPHTTIFLHVRHHATCLLFRPAHLRHTTHTAPAIGDSRGRSRTHTHRLISRFGMVTVRPSTRGSRITTEAMGPDNTLCRKTSGRGRETNIGIIGI